MNTIGDMQIEMDFYSHYNEFEYIHDFVILLKYKYIIIFNIVFVSYIYHL